VELGEASELAHLLDSLFAMEHDQSILAKLRKAQHLSLSCISPLIEKWKSWRLTLLHLLQSLWLIQHEDHELVDRMLSVDFTLESERRALRPSVATDHQAANKCGPELAVKDIVESETSQSFCLLEGFAHERRSLCELSNMIHQVSQDILQDQHPCTKVGFI
jgi:hypothetical protein